MSHTAILRVTPQEDQDVHIVINPNSDEGEGYIEIDTLNHRVYGYNPVHRIYQGWGEPAGFSGHFVLEYPERLVDFGVFSKESKKGKELEAKGARIGAWLTFKGQTEKSMELRTASSFTGKENAISNLEKEVDNLASSFDEMRERAIDAWCDRFHTIDVQSKDTAKVNQFYGAFYRASFLPRQMSDVNGDYPPLLMERRSKRILHSSLFILHSQKHTEISLCGISIVPNFLSIISSRQLCRVT